MLKSYLAFCVLTFFALASAGWAQDASNMKGNWICKTNCTCKLSSPQKFASISEKGVARNECGFESNVTFTGGGIKAVEWKLSGDISKDNNSITWKNGTVWIRQPAKADKLDILVAYWESQTFYCGARNQHFPSKEAEGGAPKCDDGDSVMFNALLCRNGDQRGCDAIARSQDADGRFWRSPVKMLLRPEEPKNPFKGGQTTFSADHAAGLFVYFNHTLDARAFKKWIKWIDRNEVCVTWCGSMPPGTPRYCKNDRCTFRIGDCQTLLLLGTRMNVAVPFCSADLLKTVPTVTNLAATFKSAYHQAVKKMKIKPPGMDIVEKVFDESLKVYESAIAPVELLRTKLEARLVEGLLLTQIHESISVLVNAKGYSRHNALVQVMLLEDMGLGRSWMNDAAIKVAKDEPANPFFQYVAYRYKNKKSMLPLILAECPSSETDPHKRRLQWSWERDSAKKEWEHTMYWDCIFIAHLYREPGSYPPYGKDLDLGPATDALNLAIKQLEELQKLVEIALKQVQEVAAIASDPTKLITDIIKDPVGTAKRQMAQVNAAAGQVVKVTNRMLKNTANAAEDVLKNVPTVVKVDLTVPELKIPTKPTDVIPKKPQDAVPEVKVDSGGVEVKIPIPSPIPIPIPKIHVDNPFD